MIPSTRLGGMPLPGSHHTELTPSRESGAFSAEAAHLSCDSVFPLLSLLDVT